MYVFYRNTSCIRTFFFLTRRSSSSATTSSAMVKEKVTIEINKKKCVFFCSFFNSRPKKVTFTYYMYILHYKPLIHINLLCQLRNLGLHPVVSCSVLRYYRHNECYLAECYNMLGHNIDLGGVKSHWLRR